MTVPTHKLPTDNFKVPVKDGKQLVRYSIFKKAYHCDKK